MPDEFVNEFETDYITQDYSGVVEPDVPFYGGMHKYGGVVEPQVPLYGGAPVRYGAVPGSGEMPIRDALRPYAVPLITVAGIGFLVWSVYKVYFEDVYYAPKEGKRAASKKAWGTFIENVQGGMLGGMAFMMFVALLVSLKGWFNGEDFGAAIGRLKNTLSGAMMLQDMQQQ